MTGVGRQTPSPAPSSSPSSQPPRVCPDLWHCMSGGLSVPQGP